MPRIIYGTANFGMGVDSLDSARELLDAALKCRISELDSAARYPPSNPGRSESLLGELGASEQGFEIDTKILASNQDGSGELSKENIERSLTDSLVRLGVEKVNVLYCHRPDPLTPIEDQAKYFHEQYERGRFHAVSTLGAQIAFGYDETMTDISQQLGLSNFKPDMIMEWLNVCDKHGYIKPSIYQGDYNLLTREMEDSLLPLLREHGISFYAFRPMAAGFLTGALNHGKVEGTRFTNEHVGAQMTQLFDTPELKQAFTTLEVDTKKHGIEAREASLRWLAHHSSLGDRDGIILGASKAAQLVENSNAIAQGPLPHELVVAIEKLWITLRSGG